MDSIINKVEAPFKRTNIPLFKAGDKVKIHLKVKEGATERIQIFEGDIIARKGGGLNENITIRKISNGVGVEKILPLHSPNIEKIEVVKTGRVRRAKLYYVRDKVGKAAKITEVIENN